MTAAKLAPGVRRALAYCFATGDFPKGIHLATWSAAHNLATRADYLATGRFYVLKAEALAAIQREPLYLATRAILALGFSRDRSGRKRTSHSVEFAHKAGDSLEAFACRGGDGWIWLRRSSVPYQVTMRLSAASLAAYAEPGATVTAERLASGWRIAWPVWAGVAMDAAADRFDESDAMTWHASGRSPIDYAAHAIRKALGDVE